MSPADPFEMHGDIALFRASGHVTLEAAVQIITEAISRARAQGIGKLMVVASTLTGFAPPGTAARYALATQWSRAAGAAVRFALVVRPEMIDVDKFGVTVAANRGTDANIFAIEDEAMRWLQSPTSAGIAPAAAATGEQTR